MRPSPAILSSSDTTRAPQRDVAPDTPTIVHPPDLQLPVSYARSCADFDILDASVQEADIRGDPVAQSVTKPATLVSVPAVDPGSVSSKAVEPYVPVALHTSTAPAINYQPTPPAQLRRIAPLTAPQLQPTDLEPDLVIDADPEEIDASVDDEQTEPTASPPKKTQQTSVTVASAIVKPDTASSSREKIIDIHQYRNRRSEERPRSYHPRSRTPPH